MACRAEGEKWFLAKENLLNWISGKTTKLHSKLFIDFAIKCHIRQTLVFSHLIFRLLSLLSHFESFFCSFFVHLQYNLVCFSHFFLSLSSFTSMWILKITQEECWWIKLFLRMHLDTKHLWRIKPLTSINQDKNQTVMKSINFSF